MTPRTCPPCTGKCHQGRACPGNAWAETIIEADEEAPASTLGQRVAAIATGLMQGAAIVFTVLSGMVVVRWLMGAP